jgi:AraC-like DNA-binding protein
VSSFNVKNKIHADDDYQSDISGTDDMKAANQIRFYRDSQIKGVEACNVISSTHKFPRHSHENIYAISFMESGGSYWNDNKKSASLVLPGNIAVINPGQIHSGEPAENQSSTYKMLYLDRSLFIQNTFCPQFKNIINNDPHLPELFKILHNSILNDSEQLEKEIHLTNFIGKLMETYSLPLVKPEKISRERDLIKRASEYLSEDLDRKMTLEELSRQTGFSPYHFLRLFKKSTGVAPHHFRTQKRIERAKNLIIEGLSFSEVALATGFSDQSHFSNTFRNYMGCTPRQYYLGV